MQKGGMFIHVNHDDLAFDLHTKGVKRAIFASELYHSGSWRNNLITEVENMDLRVVVK